MVPECMSKCSWRRMLSVDAGRLRTVVRSWANKSCSQKASLELLTHRILKPHASWQLLHPLCHQFPNKSPKIKNTWKNNLEAPPLPPTSCIRGLDGSILGGFDGFWIRIGWKWARIHGKGYANTTYISEFHPWIPKPWFGLIHFLIFAYFTCFEILNVFLQFYLINLGRE